MKHWINTLFFIFTIFYAIHCLADNVYYRYRDENGIMTMASILPPDRADAGYDVVSQNGEIIQTIPPKNVTSHSENSEKKETPKPITREEQEKRQDELLLQSFTSQKEIERARDDKVASIKIFEGIVEENLHSLNKQLQSINDSIAARKQNNETIPANVQKNLEDTLRQIKEGETFLAKKVSEREKIQEKYNNFITRFNEMRKPNDTEQPTENVSSPKN